MIRSELCKQPFFDCVKVICWCLLQLVQGCLCSSNSFIFESVEHKLKLFVDSLPLPGHFNRNTCVHVEAEAEVVVVVEVVVSVVVVVVVVVIVVVVLFLTS